MRIEVDAQFLEFVLGAIRDYKTGETSYKYKLEFWLESRLDDAKREECAPETRPFTNAFDNDLNKADGLKTRRKYATRSF